VWLLKKSLAEIAPKKRRSRKPYKRFSPTSDTFLVTHFEPDFGKTDFFNSYAPYHQLPRTACRCRRYRI
jgi:hypothetical protein